MRTKRDPASPWGYRIWFDEPEFDAMMDEARERAGVELYTPGRGVDVEELLLRVYGLSPDYAADLPETVLGRTLFHTGGEIEIQISRELSEKAATDRTARRRLRSTIAHEGAHVVEHGHLHIADGTGSLFEEEPCPTTRILCRSKTIHGYRGEFHGEWWEYQANRGMTSLLLPKQLVMSQVHQALADHGHPSMTDALVYGKAKEVISDVADNFDTSFEMTLYRLQDLGFIPNDARQLALTG